MFLKPFQKYAVATGIPLTPRLASPRIILTSPRSAKVEPAEDVRPKSYEDTPHDANKRFKGAGILVARNFVFGFSIVCLWLLVLGFAFQ